MTAKQYLKQLWMLDTQIELKKKELSDLRDASTAIGSFDYSKDRVQTSPSGDPPYLAMLDRILSLEQEIQRCLDRKRDIIGQIHSMANPVYVQILYKRYAEGKQLDIIADEMSYSYGYIRQLHGKALEEFQSSNKI